jgi:hypothetical protein
MPPPNLKIVLASGWFAFCGCYFSWVAFIYSNWSVGAFGVLALAGAAGLILRWQWAHWLVYFLAFVIVCRWLYYLLVAFRAYSARPFGSSASLIAFLVVVIATIWSADTVRRQYRLARKQA